MINFEDYEINVPIVLFIFLRLENVLNTIRICKELKAKNLIIVGEGPRNNKIGEAEKVKHIREKVLEAIDWDCTVDTDFVDNDIGAGNRIATGISFALSKYDKAIFLEDDIEPSKQFFYFCEYLLNKYENDKRIMAVCGCNMIQKYDTEDSYLFTQIPFPWGWGTWRRAWEGYDYHIETWKKTKQSKMLYNLAPDKLLFYLREKEWDIASKGIDFTWDFQFAYHIAINSGLVIVPKDNLIKYNGFDLEATNSKCSSRFDNVISNLNLPIKDPYLIVRNIDYERKYHQIWSFNNKVCRTKFKIWVRRIFDKEREK